MDLEKLWNEKRWLFWLLLPVVIVVFVMRIFEKAQVHQAEKAVVKAEKKNEKLQETIHVNEIKIAEKKTQIQEKKKKIEERKANDVPLDWHKRFKL